MSYNLARRAKLELTSRMELDAGFSPVATSMEIGLGYAWDSGIAGGGTSRSTGRQLRTRRFGRRRAAELLIFHSLSYQLNYPPAP